MSIHSKSILILLSTLLIGILLGVVIDRMWLQKYIHRRIARLRTSEGWVDMLERQIAPADSQKVIIRKILTDHAEKMKAFHEKGRQQIGALMDSLRTELEPYLTEEQKTLFNERFERFRKWPKKGAYFEHRDRKRPPPPPPKTPPGESP